MPKGKRLIVESKDYGMLKFLQDMAEHYGVADKIKVEDIL